MTKLITISIVIIVVIASILTFYLWANKVEDRSVEDLIDKWAPRPSRFLEVDGMHVHIRDEGIQNELPPIVLIHGTSASLHTWEGWTVILKQDRRVISFDIPAFGLTGPHPQNDYTIEAYTRFVINVLDSLEIDSAVLVGNSLGGYIAWASAIFYPERVSQLVLVDASGYPYESSSVPLAFRLSQNPVTRQLLRGFFPKSIVRSSVENVYGDPSQVTDELVDRYYELSLRQGNREALSERFKQTQPGELSARIPEIQVPTLILWGGKDRLIPPSLGERFHSEITGSELVVFDELGHVPHEEAPGLTAEVVQNFLSSVTP